MRPAVHINPRSHPPYPDHHPDATYALANGEGDRKTDGNDNATLLLNGQGHPVTACSRGPIPTLRDFAGNMTEQTFLLVATDLLRGTYLRNPG